VSEIHGIAIGLCSVRTNILKMCVCTDAFFDASSVRPGVFCFGLGLETCLQEVIAIRLPTDASVYFVYLFPLFLPYMFRALISPSSGVSQAVFYIQPFG